MVNCAENVRRRATIVCVRLKLEPAQRDAWEAVLDALDAITPTIEDAGIGRAYCDMRGINGNPKRWMKAIKAALSDFSFSSALGAGSNRFVARVAAERGDGTICEAGDEERFVSPMPLAMLELEPDVEARLNVLGIETLGDLAALPHGPFVRRFGTQAARWHALARGVDDAPLVPRPHRTRIERSLFGEGSAASEEALLFALRALVARVTDDLVHAGKRAAELLLELQCENGDVRRIAVAVANPTAREGMLFDLVRARLEGVQLEAPVEGLRLGIERMESGGVPLGLFAGDDPDAEAVELALARLEAAFGENSVLRARAVDGHRPESQVTYERFTGAWQRSTTTIPKTLAMQYRTCAPREVDVVVQGGVPRFVGTPPQAIADLAGPWRTEEAWWSDASLARDDYDVMLADGALLRIARRDERWYVLGVYD
jgi:protein ImuB